MQSIDILAPHKVAIITRGGTSTKIVADSSNSRILAINADGIICIIAGTGYLGFRDGPSLESQFRNPRGVAVMKDHTIIVADSGNNCIRAIGLDGIVRTIAGSGVRGFQNGLGSESQFNYPCGVVIMPDQSIIVADTDNHSIRAIYNIDGFYHVRTIAGNGELGFSEGNGTVAQFRFPSDVAVMADQSIVVADSGNHCIRVLRTNREINHAIRDDVLTAGDYTMTTIAGNGISGLRDGPGIESQFNSPSAIAVRGDQIIVADSRNHCIRIIHADHSVSHIADNGIIENQYNLGREVKFICPSGIAIMPDQTIIVTDAVSNYICRIPEERPLYMQIPYHGYSIMSASQLLTIAINITIKSLN
jgi:DNA-binding beta-propeller fold protein YncE